MTRKPAHTHRKGDINIENLINWLLLLVPDFRGLPVYGCRWASGSSFVWHCKNTNRINECRVSECARWLLLTSDLILNLWRKSDHRFVHDLFRPECRGSILSNVSIHQYPLGSVTQNSKFTFKCSIFLICSLWTWPFTPQIHCSLLSKIINSNFNHSHAISKELLPGIGWHQLTGCSIESV